MDLNENIDLKVTYRLLPSYLLTFFPQLASEEVELVYLKRQEYTSGISETPAKNFTLEKSQLDVTGSPLKVNLGDDETLIIDNNLNQYFPEDENKHYPIPITSARKYLNTDLSEKKVTIFAVCDGKDLLKTVILGYRKYKNNEFNCSINILGLLTLEDECLIYEKMEKQHYYLSRIKGYLVKCLYTFKYYVYGEFMLNANFQSKYIGSICIATNSTTKCNLNNITDLKNEIKLTLQVVIGHEKSMIYFLWKELVALQNYINIMKQIKINPTTIICKEPLFKSDIIENINCVINDKYKREIVEFNLEHIRQLNITDKLWNVLKFCENVEMLQMGFNYFFEELEANRYTGPALSGDYKLAVIINNVNNGKLLVPTITEKQAVEFLLDLGIEKLKNDYFAICEHFSVQSYQNIQSKWNKMVNKLNENSFDPKSRVTQCLKESNNYFKAYQPKLDYLGNLHVATELIYLVKDTYLPEETFDSYCTKIFEKYESNDFKNVCFQKLQENQLYKSDIILHLQPYSDYIANIKEKKPDYCSISLTTHHDDIETETLYVLSKHMLFPNTIYNDYAVDDIEHDVYYYGYLLQSQEEKDDF